MVFSLPEDLNSLDVFERHAVSRPERVSQLEKEPVMVVGHDGTGAFMIDP
jgi:hypothetical protein